MKTLSKFMYPVPSPIILFLFLLQQFHLRAHHPLLRGLNLDSFIVLVSFDSNPAELLQLTLHLPARHVIVADVQNDMALNNSMVLELVSHELLHDAVKLESGVQDEARENGETRG